MCTLAETQSSIGKIIQSLTNRLTRRYTCGSVTRHVRKALSHSSASHLLFCVSKRLTLPQSSEENAASLDNRAAHPQICPIEHDVSALPSERNRIILCGTGSVASVNLPGCAAELSENTERPVDVVLTPNALRFTTVLAIESVSGQRVWVTRFGTSDDGFPLHVALNDHALVILVYPASANFIARISHGLATDLASTVVLSATVPVLIFPNMNRTMWENVATRNNMDTLSKRGYRVIRPNERNRPLGESVIVSSVNQVVKEAVLFLSSVLPSRIKINPMQRSPHVE